MATFTTNYNLKKPAASDFVDVEDFNDNADIIDAELKKRAELGADGKVKTEQLPEMSFDPTDDINEAITTHNSSNTAHDDLRVLIAACADEPIIGTAPPTTSTVGTVGQQYIDKTNKRVWYCTAAGATGYAWILTAAGLSTKVNTTLSASGWSTAKKYTLSNANITATSAVELLPRENNGITQAQMEALSGAMIVGGTQAEGSIQLVALGDVPTIDIPVTIIIRRDL